MYIKAFSFFFKFAYDAANITKTLISLSLYDNNISAIHYLLQR